MIEPRSPDFPAGADSGAPTSDRRQGAARTVGPVADHRSARPGTLTRWINLVDAAIEAVIGAVIDHIFIAWPEETAQAAKEES